MQAPSWARALIVAELEHDDCDMQTVRLVRWRCLTGALSWVG